MATSVRAMCQRRPQAVVARPPSALAGLRAPGEATGHCRVLSVLQLSERTACAHRRRRPSACSPCLSQARGSPLPTVDAGAAPRRVQQRPQQQQQSQQAAAALLQRLAPAQQQRRRPCLQRAGAMAVAAAAAAGEAAAKGPVVVVDNYDSFTYNLCQVGAGRAGC